ncbi:hypothetical protein AVEN_247215-1 [Araneus ventricosus]|uniref:Alpha-latrotoxin n=1 Tax=Araneus ventricosus TaxID=182803 RepID=A0A4Y2ERP3_ARAVE|nr:hypothetical protein AVEN_247215-1 [Araneus ventricosus]
MIASYQPLENCHHELDNDENPYCFNCLRLRFIFVALADRWEGRTKGVTTFQNLIERDISIRNGYRSEEADYVRSDDHLEEIRELLNLGADPNYQTISGSTPLQAAAMSQNINIKAAQELFRSCIEVDLNNHLSYTELHYAVIKHKQRVVNELLQAGALVNAKTFLIFTKAPLHVAVRRFSNDSSTILDPDPWIIKYLLEHEDTDCNARDFWGNTPLMVAIMDKQVEAAKLLLDKKQIQIYAIIFPNLLYMWRFLYCHGLLQLNFCSVEPVFILRIKRDRLRCIFS